MAGAPTAATSYPQWETDLISAMGFAATQPVYEALNLWAESEGVAATSNNPLAVCCHPDGNTGCIAQCGPGGSPIYSYGTRAAGVAATAAFLSGSNSAGIVAALRDPNATLGSIYAAINGSHWCSGCQNGHYPVDLFQALGGNAPATIFRGGASDSGGSSSSGGQPVAPTGGVGCSTGSQGVDILGAHFFTACQVKALVGGLLIGAGAGFLLTGTAILAMSALRGSKTGRAVAKYVPSPGKAAARVVTRRATAAGGQARSAAGSSSSGGGTAPPVRQPDPVEAMRAEQRQAEKKEQQRQQRREERVQDRIRIEQEKGSQRRATNAARERRTVQGAPRRYIPPAGSRERRERAAQPF